MYSRKYPRNSIAPIVHLRTRLMQLNDNDLLKFERNTRKKLKDRQMELNSRRKQAESDDRITERLKIAMTVINSEKTKRDIQQ